MGFLNILAYIGVGLAAAGIFIGTSYAMSRPKETILYEDGSVERGKGYGDWGIAMGISALGSCLFATLLLINLAHFSILKSIGLGLLSGVILCVLLYFVTGKKQIADVIQTIITCLLNGAAFAILAYNWGWF